MTVFEFNWQEEPGWYCNTHNVFFPFQSGVFSSGARPDASLLVSHVQGNLPCDISNVVRMTSGVFAGLGVVVTLAVKNATASFLVADEDHINADATSAPITVTLPAAPSPGRELTVKKTDVSVNGVTLDGNGHNVEGASTLQLLIENQSATIIFDGTTWRVR